MEDQADIFTAAILSWHESILEARQAIETVPDGMLSRDQWRVERLADGRTILMDRVERGYACWRVVDDAEASALVPLPPERASDWAASVGFMPR